MTQLWQRRLDRRRESTRSVPGQPSTAALPELPKSGEQLPDRAMSGTRFGRLRPGPLRSAQLRCVVGAAMRRAAASEQVCALSGAAVRQQDDA